MILFVQKGDYANFNDEGRNLIDEEKYDRIKMAYKEEELNETRKK